MASSDPKKKCPLCSSSPVQLDVLTNRDSYWVECKTCGRYMITFEAMPRAQELSQEDRYLVISFVRRWWKNNDRPYEIMEKHLVNPLDGLGIRPFSVFEKIDAILELLGTKSGFLGAVVAIDLDHDWPLIGAHGPAEARKLLDHVRKMGLASYVDVSLASHTPPGIPLELSVKGWEKFEQLQRHDKKLDQAFVAMSFAPEMQQAWTGGFEPAISACKYRPQRVDLKEHNQKICDVILAEIRKSAFLIADFTGNRGGVYFESGFALGLGLPIIWTCRSDQIKDLHFDTRQYNHIAWDSPEVLKERLIHRIQATVPRR